VNIGNGRLLPTTPWESLWNGMCQWLDISLDAPLNTLLPNRNNFPKSTLFTKNMLFKQ
jgi:hypothetical protein